MIFAQVKDGVVQNIIVLDDMSLISLFSQGFDYFIRIDQLSPYPSPGWLFDGMNFTSPDGE